MTSSSDAFVTKRHLVSFVCVPVVFLRSGWNVTETSFWYLPQVICKHLTVLNWGAVLLVIENKKVLHQIVCSVSVMYHFPPCLMIREMQHFTGTRRCLHNPEFRIYFFPTANALKWHNYLNWHTEWKTSSQVSKTLNTFSVLHTFSNSTGHLLNELNTVFCVKKKSDIKPPFNTLFKMMNLLANMRHLIISTPQRMIGCASNRK